MDGVVGGASMICAYYVVFLNVFARLIVYLPAAAYDMLACGVADM